MQKLVYSLFLAIFSLDYLSRVNLIPRYATWLPELLSVGAFAAVMFVLAHRKNIDIPGRYWAVFAVLGLIIVCGAVLNGIPAGTLFTGLRNYAKFIPFFLLPAVVSFTESELRRQLMLLLILSSMQLPIALYQRFVQTLNLFSGDSVKGTLTDSGVLSVFLLCAICIATAFYVKKRLALWQFLTILIVLFVPTTINETKMTFFVLPFAVLVPFFAVTKDARRLSRLLGMFALLGVMFMTFLTVYDQIYSARWGYGFLEFLTEEDRLEGYLAPHESRGSVDRVGKLDSVVLPFQKLDDPTQLMLGLGVGNVSTSFLGDEYSGAYFAEYGPFIKVAFSNLVWEVGVLGALTLCVFGFMVLLDTLQLKDDEDVHGVFALGWTGCLVVIGISLIYKRAIYTNEIGYLFWYFSGVMVATAFRQREQRLWNTAGLFEGNVQRAERTT